MALFSLAPTRLDSTVFTVFTPFTWIYTNIFRVLLGPRPFLPGKLWETLSIRSRSRSPDTHLCPLHGQGKPRPSPGQVPHFEGGRLLGAGSRSRVGVVEDDSLGTVLYLGQGYTQVHNLEKAQTISSVWGMLWQKKRE